MRDNPSGRQGPSWRGSSKQKQEQSNLQRYTLNRDYDNPVPSHSHASTSAAASSTSGVVDNSLATLQNSPSAKKRRSRPRQVRQAPEEPLASRAGMGNAFGRCMSQSQAGRSRQPLLDTLENADNSATIRGHPAYMVGSEGNSDRRTSVRTSSLSRIEVAISSASSSPSTKAKKKRRVESAIDEGTDRNWRGSSSSHMRAACIHDDRSSRAPSGAIPSREMTARTYHLHSRSLTRDSSVLNSSRAAPPTSDIETNDSDSGIVLSDSSPLSLSPSSSQAPSKNTVKSLQRKISTLKAQLAERSELVDLLRQQQEDMEECVRVMTDRLVEQDAVISRALVQRDAWKESLKQRQNAVTCVICMDFFSVPHILPCGHTFCYPCLTDWLSQKRQCPTCRNPISAAPVHSIITRDLVKQVISELQQSAQLEHALSDPSTQAESTPSRVQSKGKGKGKARAPHGLEDAGSSAARGEGDEFRAALDRITGDEATYREDGGVKGWDRFFTRRRDRDEEDDGDEFPFWSSDSEEGDDDDDESSDDDDTESDDADDSDDDSEDDSDDSETSDESSDDGDDDEARRRRRRRLRRQREEDESIALMYGITIGAALWS
ncbi:E3 ubiquitin ligase [Quaeritorhiza haematococci]|nr:E3 ubiquitin ligase [Quaeritorhiza haematococci]